MVRHEGTVRLPSGLTWYRITGDLDAGQAPLLVLHGGPGSTHDYLDAYRDLADAGRAVIHYDQIGNGRSAPASGQSAAFWTVDLFLAQLDDLIEHLGIGGRYALLGHSWGGMLAAEHAVLQPVGLTALVLANAPASMTVWAAEAERLVAELPADVRATLARCEQAGTADHPAYKKAAAVYEQRHVCRLNRWPPELIRTAAFKDAHPAVYAAMIGPSDFHIIGTLRDWTIVDRCAQIAVPTLLISGRHDEATPPTIQPFADRIADVRWVMFEEAAHMPHLEERTACMSAVSAFLAQVEGAAVSPRLGKDRDAGAGSQPGLRPVPT